MELCLIYGMAAIVSLIVILGYYKFIKNRDIHFILLYVSVFVVNSGYFMLAMSDTLEGALMSNRLAYLGSVMLPLCMMMILMDVCHLGDRKMAKGILTGFSIVVFLIAASQGILDIYYADVDLVFIDGAAKLVKVYGPLHIVYYIYLFSYFAVMIGIILFASLKKKIFDMKYAAMLLVIVFGNIIIWLIEQRIDTDFEFLSISYIITEMFLLLIYGMVEDRTIITAVISGKDDVVLDREHLSRSCPELNVLTDREWEVVIAMLQDKKRKEIADELSVTEHTIKKHTAHIFAKLEVTNRKELHEKLKIK